MSRLALLTLAFCLAAGLALVGGFLWFASHLPSDDTVLRQDYDGIVVLTGGASRISDGLELLAAGRGKRLLISGVNRTTTAAEIARLNPDFSRFAKCCIDFDHSLNTLGNAIETRRWVKDRSIGSLILVTSSYHMPRAMAELARQIPDVRMVAYPVVSERMRAEPWWANPVTARLVATEYLKFVFAHVRMTVNPDASASG